jgi:hypothetical protein
VLPITKKEKEPKEKEVAATKEEALNGEPPTLIEFS